jgi:uncharacterized protein DUF6580
MKAFADDHGTSPLLHTMLVLALLLLCAALRLAPHPWNFTPVGAMAIFAGAVVRNRSWALLFPIVVMFATDLIIGFNSLSPLVYASLALSVLISRVVVGARLSASPRERSEPAISFNRRQYPAWFSATSAVAGATFLGSLQFFLVTNFGAWAFLGSYPRTPAGLAACYLAGLPLFLNTLAGDFIYAALLFSAFALASYFVRARFSASHQV